MGYRRAVLNTKWFNAWAKFVAIKMGRADGPHLRLLKTVAKSISYPFWISVYSLEWTETIRRGEKKEKKGQLN